VAVAVLSDADRTIIEAHLSVIDAYDEQIEKVGEKIERKILESPAAQRLLTIPGVGQYTAVVIVAEVGEVERFDEDKQPVSYAGLDPVVYQSGDKKVRGSISKEGSAPLRRALVQCANIAVRCDEYPGNFYTRLKQRKNHQIVIVATARKMLVSIFHMFTRKELYDPPGVSA
jgi:transposase